MKAILTAISIGLSLMTGSQLALAGDSDYRIHVQSRSAAAALSGESLPKLQRIAGPGQARAWQLALEATGRSDDGTARTSPRAVSMRTLDWDLEVSGNGTQIRFRDTAHLRSGAASGRPAADRPDARTLEAEGRAFIETSLAKFVHLGDKETLELWRTSYEIDMVAAVDGSSRVETLASSTVTFTRAVDGVPVVGPGSKVAVVFSAYGQPAGFDVNWSQLQSVGEPEPTMSKAELDFHSEAIAARRRAATQQRLSTECGYFDTGAAADDGSALKAACIVRYRVGAVNGPQGAYEDIVPLTSSSADTHDPASADAPVPGTQQ